MVSKDVRCSENQTNLKLINGWKTTEVTNHFRSSLPSRLFIRIMVRTMKTGVKGRICEKAENQRPELGSEPWRKIQVYGFREKQEAQVRRQKHGRCRLESSKLSGMGKAETRTPRIKEEMPDICSRLFIDILTVYLPESCI